MRLRKGSVIIPYEKVFVYMGKNYILKMTKALVEMLNNNTELFVLLEPAVSKVTIGEKKYFVTLSIGSLIVPLQTSEILDYLYSKFGNNLWILDEDVWVKASRLSASKVYVHKFYGSELLNYFNGLVDEVSIADTQIPYISRHENPLIDIDIKEKRLIKPEIKLLKPGHIVVNGLREAITYSSRIEISLYVVSIDELNRKPLDILALASNLPLILEQINEKTIIVLVGNLEEYPSVVRDLILYNSVIYMLTL